MAIEMSGSSNSLVPLSLLVSVVVFNGFVWFYMPPGHFVSHEVRLSGPYIHEQGNAFVVDMPVKLPSDETNFQASRIELYEQGAPLGPPHTAHTVIRNQGSGGFSHWRDQLYFSASDNSDPNTNRRAYLLRYRATLPVFLYVLLLLLDCFLVAFGVNKFITKHWESSIRQNTALKTVTIALMTGILIQATFWVLIEDAVANQSERAQKLFKHVFGSKAQLDFAPGESINFSEHQYLNYVLNPDVSYGDAKQFNAEYRIRRAEPIRSRDRVRWRGLVLGGSTTFGELLRREEDTWVFQLEKRVRNQCGAACDVINAGIGGYTVLENLIHYVILLNNLQPDVVLLYEGINDVDARLFGEIAPDYSNYRIPWRSQGSVYPAVNPLLSWLYPYQYYFLFVHILQVQQIGIGGVVSPPHPPPYEWETALERNKPDIYQTHLRNLIHLLRAEGRQVVILPQYFIVVNGEDKIFVKGVLQHNEINRNLAEELQIPFLGRLTADATFGREDTVDNCHFNERGSVKMAEEVFHFLMQRKLIPLNVSS